MGTSLAAIITVWNGLEILPHVLKNITPLVDGIFIVISERSNFGEAVTEFPDYLIGQFGKIEPDPKLSPMINETRKRNFGLDNMRRQGFTHFLMMDCDELYDPKEFTREKERIYREDLAGTVCRSKVYFRSPTLTIGYDTTLVPFIHKITPTLAFGMNQSYPFAFTDTDTVPFTPKKRIRIDPTRQMNITSGVAWSPITMHHYSWVRNDIGSKIRNSTARGNIEKSTIVSDYRDAKPGYFCQFYGKSLESCPNQFDIPEIIDENLQIEGSVKIKPTA